MDFLDYADIKVGLDEYVLRVSINRPERKNALRMETISELNHILEQAKDSSEVRVFVLSGEGGSFCAGADLKAMRGGNTDEKKSPIAIDAGGFPKLNLLLENLGKPSIASVEGFAVAGGMGLMMACDICIAQSDAFFQTPEIKRGLWPMMIMRPLFKAMPYKSAVELILTGRRIDATEAVRLGVITRAVDPGTLQMETDKTANELAGYSPIIMRLGLNAMHKQLGMSSDEGLGYLESQLQECMKTEDFFEGITAFAEKRKPEWKGR